MSYAAIIQRLDHFLPEACRDWATVRLYRARALILACLFQLLALVFQLFVQDYGTINSIGWTLLGWVLVLTYLRLSGQVEVAIMVFVVLGAGQAYWQLVQASTLYSLGYIWFPCYALLASLLLGIGKGLYLSIFCAVLGSLAVLSNMGKGVEAGSFSTFEALFEHNLIQVSTAGLMMLAIAAGYEYLRSGAEREALLHIERAGHAEKLAAVGDLVPNLAREMQAPLADIHAALSRLEFASPQTLRREDRDEVLLAMEREWMRLRLSFEKLQLFRSLEDSEWQEIQTPLVFQWLKDNVALVQGIQRFDMTFDDHSLGQPAFIPWRETQQVLLNLVLQAIDRTKSQVGGQVRLEAHEQGGDLVVDVYDNGPLISEAMLRHMFEPHFIEASVTRQRRLGLYVCRMLIERQGGQLEARAAAGWNRLSVRLPGKRHSYVRSDDRTKRTA